MIPWWIVLAGFVVGVLGAVLAAEVGGLLQRAEDGRVGRPGEVSAGPPYDWSQEPDL